MGVQVVYSLEKKFLLPGPENGRHFSIEDPPIPRRETRKSKYMSPGDMKRQKIITGQREFIYRQKII